MTATDHYTRHFDITPTSRTLIHNQATSAIRLLKLETPPSPPPLPYLVVHSGVDHEQGRLLYVQVVVRHHLQESLHMRRKDVNRGFASHAVFQRRCQRPSDIFVRAKGWDGVGRGDGNILVSNDTDGEEWREVE